MASDKLQHVQFTLDTLRADLSDRHLSAHDRAKTLGQLKLYGRDPKGCDPIFTKEGIEVLAKHGFEEEDRATAREALRCLANALLLVPRTRQLLVDGGWHEKAAAGFEGADVDDEFLMARLLLLITYDTSVDLNRLLEEFRLEANIDNAIARHAKTYDGKAKSTAPSAMDDMALGETLKLTFNLSHFVQEQRLTEAAATTSAVLPESLFIKSVPNLFLILLRRDLAPFPLRPPITSVINALLNVDLLACKDEVFPPPDRLRNIKRLVEILDKSINPEYTKLSSETSESFDDNGAPLVTLLRQIVATVGDDDIKSHLKSRLLPGEQERNQPLGKGASLASRLLQLSSSASAPNTRESISYLLFELSNENAEEFVQNIGYGYASGFLATHNIPVPASLGSPDTTATAVNPVTGQTLDSEPVGADPFEGMSQDEKEREAERLFVLFESLKKTGVVDVKNPVEVAMEKGRFQELDDDSDQGEL